MAREASSRAPKGSHLADHRWAQCAGESHAALCAFWKASRANRRWQVYPAAEVLREWRDWDRDPCAVIWPVCQGSGAGKLREFNKRTTHFSKKLWTQVSSQLFFREIPEFEPYHMRVRCRWQNTASYQRYLQQSFCLLEKDWKSLSLADIIR